MDGYDLNRINKLLKLCQDNYKEKTLAHVIRVANYALENAVLSVVALDRDFLYYCALAHDLIEDTDVSYEEITQAMDKYSLEKVTTTLSLLTHNKEQESYIDYIKRIRDSGNITAYIIKIADMKDHLTLLNTETYELSDEIKEKLRKKYNEALPYLL